jgi:hypothetical protein
MAQRLVRPSWNAQLVNLPTSREAEGSWDIAGCTQLRSLRSTAGRALIKGWKGQPIEIGVDHDWIAQLVGKLRQQVEVFEVERITFGEVPEMMIGWWVPSETARRFELVWGSSRGSLSVSEHGLPVDEDA